MTSRTIFFLLVGEFFGFLFERFCFSSKKKVGLDGFCEVKVPDLNLWQEGAYNGIISFGRAAAVDGAEGDSEPFDIKGKC